MSSFLRLAALLSVFWIVALLWPAQPPAIGAPPARALAHSLAIAHAGLALLFWRAAANPARERSAIYVAMLVLGLRAAHGTYQVLYVLESAMAIAGLADMVLSLALFTGFVNALPGTLRGEIGDE